MWGSRDRECEKFTGLVTQLSRAVGIVAKLSHVLCPKTLRSVAMGLWQSRLMFGLPLVGGVWIPQKYVEKEWNHVGTTKWEMAILQRSQNRLMRILTAEKDLHTPTTVLLANARMLSVHQLSFVATATVTKRALETGSPHWLSTALEPMPVSRTLRGDLQALRHKSSLRGESLAVKAVRVFNYLPEDLKTLPLNQFRKKVKVWAQHNVPARPP